MYELKKTGKVFTSKFVGTGPSSYEKRIYRAAVSQRLRNTGFEQRIKKFSTFLPLFIYLSPFHILNSQINISYRL